MATKNIQKILNTYSDAVRTYNSACISRKNKDWGKYEHQLCVSIRHVVNVLELSLKTYIRNEIEKRDYDENIYKKMKAPSFHSLISILKDISNPKIESEMISRFYEYRKVRNAIEHDDSSIPSVEIVQDALNDVNQFLKKYLQSPTDIKINIIQENEKTEEAPILKSRQLIIGRDFELKKANELLNTSINSNIGSVIILKGVSGTGKTFLANQICELAREKGFTVGASACEPFQNGIALFPLYDLIKQISKKSNLLEAIQELYPIDSSQMSLARNSQDSSISPDQRRESTIATLANVIYGKIGLKYVESFCPILLFIDDMEWIDSDTLDAILCFKARFNQGPLIIMGSYRTDIVSLSKNQTPIKNLISVVSRSSKAETIDIKALKKDNTEKLIESILGDKINFPKKFVTRLYSESEGNPLFLREIIRLLSESKSSEGESILDFKDNYWSLTQKVEHIDIPISIEDTIKARLNLLNPSLLNELQKASVIGRSFTFFVLAKLSKTDESKLFETIETFLNVELIKELQEDQIGFEFTHGKIRDVVYKNIPNFKKVFIHKEVASIFLELKNEAYPGNWDGPIAIHLYKSNDFESSIKYSLISARNNFSLGAFAQAREQYQLTLDSGNRTSYPIEENENKIRLEYVRTLRVLGEYSLAIEQLNKVDLNNIPPDLAGEIFNEKGDIFWLSGKMEKSLNAYLECKTIAFNNNIGFLKLEVSADLCEYFDRESERLISIDVEKAKEYRCQSDTFLEKQLKLVEEFGSPQSKARAYRNKAKYERRNNKLNSSIQLYEKAISFLEENNFDHKILISYAKTLRLVSRFEDAWQVIQRVVDWGEQMGLQRTEAIGRQYMGLLLLEKQTGNNFEDAEKELLNSFTIHNRINYDRGIREVSMILGELNSKKKNWEVATIYFSKSSGISSKEFLIQAKATCNQLDMMQEKIRCSSLKLIIQDYEKNKQ